MGIRTGDEYREGLRDGRQVWVHGERVEDVTEHPAFQPMVDAIARMYGLQHDPRYQEVMTFRLPSGEPASRFYKLPEAPEDLARVREMTLAVLDEVGGVLAQPPSPGSRLLGKPFLLCEFLIDLGLDLFQRHTPPRLRPVV